MIKSSLFLATGLGLAGCVQAPPEHLTAPANPALHSRMRQPSPVTAGAPAHGVVEPKDWQELNRAVAPSKGAGHGH